MLTIINDLKAAVSTLSAQVNGATAQAAELKQQRDAAVTDNGVLTQRVAALEEQLGAAQGSALSAEDAAAIVSTTATIQAQAQALSDSNTVNAPSN